MYRQKRASAAAGSNAAAADTVVLSSQVFQVRPGRAADGWSADTDDIQPDIHLFSSCLEKRQSCCLPRYVLDTLVQLTFVWESEAEDVAEM